MDASLEVQWLLDRLEASGGGVVIRSASLAVGGLDRIYLFSITTK